MQFLILLFLCFHAQAQFSSSTTSKVDVIRNNATANVTLSPSGDVVLTPATVDTLIYADADKKLKSTTYSPSDVVTKDPITNEVLINGYLNLVSTTQGSVSCPVMTEAQRDLIAVPATGECVFNSNSQSLNVYDGATWKSAGGGISQWVTAFNYSIDDIVVYVGEIYQALTAHTSGTFTTDLANGDWIKIADTIQSQGLKDSSSATYKNVAVPNKQATAIGSNTVLLENGNQNLLSNPSFEHATYDTGWTCTGDSVESKETTIVIDGNASLETDATADTFECYQDTTLYEAQLSGVQGQASVWVKTNDVTVQVCARQAGATLTGANCVTVNANNEWKEYVIPFVMSTTSNGISIKGTSGTGTTYIDNAYVGIMPANRTPEISQAQIAVEAYIASATNCQWSRTSTTVGAFGTDADCPGPTIVRQNVGTWSTTDTDLPRFTGSNLPAGQYKATMIFPNFMTASAVAAAAINDGTTTCNPISITSDPGNASSNSISCTFSYDSVSTSRTYELYVGSASSTVNLPNSVTTPGFGVKFILEYYPPKSKVYSGSTIYPHAQLFGTLKSPAITNCSWSVASTTYASFAADTDCNTATATGRVSAPSTKIPAVVLPNGSPIGTYQIVANGGFANGGTTTTWGYRLFDGSNGLNPSGTSNLSSAVNVGSFGVLVGTYEKTTTNEVTIQVQAKTASFTANILNSGTGDSLDFSVYYFPPQDNPIIGTFAGIEKCEDDFECTDVFSAKVSSAGVVSDENLNWINGNFTVASPTVGTLQSNLGITTGLTCTTTPFLGGNRRFVVTSSTTSAITIQQRTSTTDATGTLDTGFQLICQKTGSDFKAKTAKAATTNEMMYVPNVTRPKTCYYAFGGASATLASPTVCAASPCVEVYDSCSAGTAPTRLGTGTHQLVFANGTWKANTAIDCKCQAYSTTTATWLECYPYFITGGNSWMTNSSGGLDTGIVTYNGAGAGQNAHVNVACTADAP